jgi:ABC-type amino acid transport system permease subunit
MRDLIAFPFVLLGILLTLVLQLVSVILSVALGIVFMPFALLGELFGDDSR